MNFKTIQGKEFEYKDILLYTVVKNKIICIVNDEELLKEFGFNGKKENAPIWIADYSNELEEKILQNMKKIQEYTVVSEKNIKVTYSDGTSIYMDLSSENIIKSNLEKQKSEEKLRELEESKKQLSSWTNLSTEEKKSKKNKSKNKWKAGIAALLAAVAIYSLGANKDKITTYITSKFCNSNLKQAEDIIKKSKVTVDSVYSAEGKKLYNEIASKSNLKINENTSIMIVELLNGHYNTTISPMDYSSKDTVTDHVADSITRIVRYNLDPNTKFENMIDLSAYMNKSLDIYFINRAMYYSKTFVSDVTRNYKIGEARWSSSERYYNSGTDLINYEINTTNDGKFLGMCAGSRLLVQTIFNEANRYMPEEAYVNREASEDNVREHHWYWRYFENDMDKKAYLPRRTKDNKIVYVYTNQYCVDEEVYTKEEMFALAGKSSLEEQKRLGIEGKLWIWEMGIQPEIENRIDDAMQEIDNMNSVKEDNKVKVR